MIWLEFWVRKVDISVGQPIYRCEFRNQITEMRNVSAEQQRMHNIILIQAK
jgi:hypothetical protein